MAWLSKEHPSPFDEQPIPGLYFAMEGTKKRAMIAFDSGLTADLWEGETPEKTEVFFGGEIAIPLNSTRDTAYRSIVLYAELNGYWVETIGETGLETINGTDHLLMFYDNETKRLVDAFQLGAG